VLAAMKLGATVANAAWLAGSIPAWAHFRRALHTPKDEQFRVLRRLLAENTGSAYGAAHDFEAITSYEQFRERVPVVHYDTLQPWIARIAEGEPGVLTSARVMRLVPTSGSTAGRKLIPFTASFQREFNAAVGPWMLDLVRQYPELPFGPAYWPVSPVLAPGEHKEHAVPIGFDDDSAYLGGARQKLVAAAMAVPSDLRMISDLETFRYATLLCLLREPELRLISVWHPSFLTLLIESLPKHWDGLMEDLEHGGFHRDSSLPAELRRVLVAPPQRHRAHSLRQIGPYSVKVLWPRLQVVSCWSDAQAALYLDHLRQHLPGVAIQSKGLLATEGVISIPFRGLHPIAVCSHFYEFADEHGAIRTADELQVGAIYSVILTNSAGLWRYRLGDLVEVDGFVGATPSLRFIGRGSQVSDLCGEKLHEIFVRTALRETFRACGVAPAFAVLAAERPIAAPPHYTLFVEGSLPPRAIELLETALRMNPHYAHCQNLGQLGVLESFHISAGAYEAFALLGCRNGQRLGDAKPQALSLRTDLREHFFETLARNPSARSVAETMRIASTESSPGESRF
jgi:hypothetical protein